MMAAIPTELLWRLMNATPEQYAAIAKILGVKQEVRMTNDEVEGAENGGSRMEDGELGCRDACCVMREEKARFLFRRAGSHWDVVFDGSEIFHLEHTVGARYVDFLLHRPGEVISAFDLEVAVCPEKANARARDSFQAELDPETVRRYLRELSRLRAEREAAAEGGDCARMDQLDADIEAVEEALQSNGRGTGDAGERARNNVRKAVARVIRRLNRGGKAEREFSAHLAKHLSLGFEVMYQPPGEEVWS
jgi:hypothetical protein